MDNLGQAEERRLKKNEQSKAYWAKNRETIASKRNVRKVCSCGREISKRHETDHVKGMFHKLGMEAGSSAT